MGFWESFKEKLKNDPKFRNRVLGATALVLGAGTVYYYGRKHGYAKAERKFEAFMLEEPEE